VTSRSPRPAGRESDPRCVCSAFTGYVPLFTAAFPQRPTTKTGTEYRQAGQRLRAPVGKHHRRSTHIRRAIRRRYIRCAGRLGESLIKPVAWHATKVYRRRRARHVQEIRRFVDGLLDKQTGATHRQGARRRTKDPADLYVFPGRESAATWTRTTPYFHDGSVATLPEAEDSWRACSRDNCLNGRDTSDVVAFWRA